MAGRILCIISILIFISTSVFSSELNEAVVISNETGFTISNLYLSYGDSDDWGMDLLKDKTLLSGESLSVPLTDPDSTYFNIKGRDIEGDTYTIFNINNEKKKILITLNNIDPD